KYSNSTKLFKRLIGISIGNWLNLTVVNQELNVQNMQELDNAAGSYLDGLGNFIAETNIAYGFNWFNLFSRPQFTHKTVLSALAINPNIWPSNGSHTLNMQGLNLMYNSFSGLANSTQSNFFGYPNLGRPSDHFSVTPFEAIYVGEKIYPHIDLEKARPIDVQAINDFIKNEVEPWYLGLQNENLGAQARSNYTYKAFRRAKYSIVVGNLVTPKTDPGDYVVEPNADLRLEAGQQIVLKPGVHIKNGATAHLKIAYQECFETNGLRVQDPVSAHSEEVNDLQRDDYLTTNIVEKEMITVFPNPTNGNFTVKTDNIINVITIYTINGQLIERISDINNSKYDCSNVLERGTYLLVIEAEDRKVFYKKLVVL
ncbi:MAG TPA: T9SS type A sorting domain-containing protein, partial [Crocinitomicaceae bacterium]|nr:T9SS type A sorting domain-containing protein [Crocinitomicaceae bacterium]